MPTFKTAQPRSIATSVSALMKSSPNLSEADIARARGINATTDQHTALAEKARIEAEALRDSMIARSDPARANEYAATTSGMTVPQGAQLGGFIRGESIPPTFAVDDGGNQMPAAQYARPDVSPEAERTFRAALGSLMANQMATGHTNAEQLTHAGGNLFAQASRAAMQGEDLPITDENQLGHSIGVQAREPFSRGPNQHGLTINQETGEVDVADQGIRDAAVKALEGLATKREADATRRRQGPVRTAAQEEKDRAYARMQNARADAASMEAKRQTESEVKSRFRNDRNMKGRKLGNWVKDKGFEVLQGDKVVGYYD